MTVGRKLGVHDILLESSDDASPTTALGLMLARDKAGKKRWREMRLPPFPFRYSQGDVQYAHKDPQRDLVFSQGDWSGGGLAPYHKGENRYALSNGCDARWDNVLTLGMKKEVADFLLINPGAERGTTTGWTAGGAYVTHTTPTAAARTGSYGHRLATTGSQSANTVLISQALSNPTLYRSRTIRVIAYLRRTTTNGGGIKIGVDDGVSAIGYSGVVTSATYTYVTRSFNVDPGAVQVVIGVYISASETGDNTYEVDDIAVIPNGGVACWGVASDGALLYGVFGRVIARWDETNDVWDLVRFDNTSALKSLVQYGGNLYAAFADGTAYVYGSSTSWTTSSITAPGQDANLFQVARQTLWKGILASVDSTNHGVYSSTNPVNGGSWSSVYVVGTVDTDITGIWAVNDTLLVGKADGAYLYKRVYNDGTSADLFTNVTLPFQADPNTDNFARGQEWFGWLYFTTAQQGFWRFDGQRFENLSSLLFAPRLSDFGGRVRALGADPAQLWLLVDTPTTDTTDAKTTWLMSLRERQGRFLLHPIEKVSIGDINWLAANNGYLWAFGRSYVTDASDYQASIYRWTLPTKTIAPAFDASPVINTSGTFETSIWDGNLPDDQKAFIALTIFTKPNILDAEHTIVAKFKIDGAASWTTLGTFSGTGAIQTKYFDTITAPETNAVGRAIQLQLTLATDDTVSPELYAFALHATLRPERVKMWEAYVTIGSPVLMNNGLQDPEDKATKLNNLSTLETQVYPIELTEYFIELDTTTTHRVQIVPGSLERAPLEETLEGVEVYRLLMQEVTVA